MISGQVSVEQLKYRNVLITIDDFSFVVDDKTAEYLAEQLDDTVTSKPRGELLTTIDEQDTKIAELEARIVELEDKINYTEVSE